MHASSVKAISVGVLHGSIIGPFLFNMFNNDIVKVSPKFAYIVYVDYATLDCSGQNVRERQAAFVTELYKKNNQ